MVLFAWCMHAHHLYACAWPLQVNNETFHRMLEEYREAKRRELDLDLKAKQCVYCLSTLLQQVQTCKGGTIDKSVAAALALQPGWPPSLPARKRLPSVLCCKQMPPPRVGLHRSCWMRSVPYPSSGRRMRSSGPSWHGATGQGGRAEVCVQWGFYRHWLRH